MGVGPPDYTQEVHRLGHHSEDLAVVDLERMKDLEHQAAAL